MTVAAQAITQLSIRFAPRDRLSRKRPAVAVGEIVYPAARLDIEPRRHGAAIAGEIYQRVEVLPSIWPALIHVRPLPSAACCKANSLCSQPRKNLLWLEMATVKSQYSNAREVSKSFSTQAAVLA